MQRRQGGEVYDACLFDRQTLDKMARALARQIGFRRFWQREFAEMILDTRLPYRRDAQEHVVLRILNQFAKGEGQLSIATDIPEEDMRIQQKSHSPSNS